MAYNPDEHRRLETLYTECGSRLQAEVGAGADRSVSLADSYRDALTTAHAVYAYLLANPVVVKPDPRGAEIHPISKERDSHAV